MKWVRLPETPRRKAMSRREKMLDEMCRLCDRVDRVGGDVHDLSGRVQHLEDKMLLSFKVLAERHVRLQERMADQLIQLAMVQRGDSKEAVGHRIQSRLQDEPQVDMWSEGNDPRRTEEEEEWPPPGYIAMSAP